MSDSATRSLEAVLGSIVRAEVEGALRQFWSGASAPAANAAPGSEFLRLREAADLVRVHPNTIRNWIGRGKIRRYGDDRRLLLVRRDELLRCVSNPGSSGRMSPEDRAARMLAR